MRLDPYTSHYQVGAYGGRDDRALMPSTWTRVRM
jgi:hypothetical protein